MEARQEKYIQRYKEVVSKPINLNGIQLPLFYFVSGFSHPVLPIIKQDGLFLYQWGLIPSWVKNEKQANDMRQKTLNAIGETVFEKASFRTSIISQRCLLPVSGFYEWRDVNKKKYPYLVKSKTNDVFSLGCIYEQWVDKTTGEVKNTFSILTTEANPLMEKIHNLKKRMPLIIALADEKKWIEPDLTREEIVVLIKPYPEEEMLAYTVSQAANSARNDRNTEAIIEPVDYPVLSLGNS